jgi:GT2 family glycosyltransferase
MNSAKLRALPVIALMLPLDCVVAAAVLLVDLLTLPLRFLRRIPESFTPPDPKSVTIQILNWDGKHLLEECLPSVLEAAGRHDVLIVDNGSRDGSIDFLKARFPRVRILALDRNYGFAVGNNRGLVHVDADIVVLLNNDMLVRRDFLGPLLDALADPSVFAATSQISFADPTRRREETGMTRGRFERGFFRLWHDAIQPAEDDQKSGAIPVFWAGGGSCAIDCRKLRLLGGLDSLYHPFYVEDADISYQAWKRGWKSVLVPQSHVVHKHRGTSRPKFGDDFIDGTIRRNQFLFIWKNVTDSGMIFRHLMELPRIHGSAVLDKGAAFELRAYARAIARLPLALWRRASNLPFYTATDRKILRHF